MASLITAAVVTLAWCGFAVWLGPRIGYLDRPDDPSLKAHQSPAVPLGGVGIFLGVHLAYLVRGGLDGVLLAATGIVLVLGLLDDRRGLAPVARLGVETVAALVLVVGMSDSGTSPLLILLGLALVLFVVNAVNLFDGLDGLAGSVALVTALGLAWLAAGRGIAPDASFGLAAALAGFLLLAWHPAKIFLGDAGAYVVGLLLAQAVIRSSPGGEMEFLIAAAVLGVFALDLIVTLIRRRLNRRPLFEGDRSHVYDQLRDRGMSIHGVVYAAAVSQAALIVIVVAVDRSLAPGQAVLALVLVGGLLLALLARSGFLRVDSR